MARFHFGWIVVIGACLCNFLLVGMSRSMGILYSSVLVSFGKSAAASATFLSIYNTLRMVLGPVASTLCEKWGCRAVVMLGGVLFALGFILSSLAVNLIYLNISFGVVGGIGGAFIFTPPYIIVGQYFEKKKGQAMSLSTIGAGLGTISLAPLEALLLRHYGSFGAWLITGGIMLNVCVAGALFRPKSAAKKKEEEEEEEDICNNETSPKNEHTGVNSSIKDTPCSLSASDGGNNVEQGPIQSDTDKKSRLPSENVLGGSASGTFSNGAENNISVINGFLNDTSAASSKSTSHVDKAGFPPFQPLSAPLSHPHLMRVRSNTTSGRIPRDSPSTRGERQRTYSSSARSQQSLVYSPDLVKKFKQAEIYSSMDKISIHTHADDDFLKAIKDEEVGKEEHAKCDKSFQLNPKASGKTLQSKRYGSDFLKMITNTSFIVYLLNVATMPFVLMTGMIYLPSLATEIGTPSESSVGLLLSLLGCADVIGRFTSGLVFDIKQIRVLKRRRLLFGITGLLFSLFSCLLGFCQTFTMLGVCTFFYGIFEGGYHAQRMTILSEFLTPVQIASAVGWSIFAQGTGNLISAPLAGYLKDIFGTFRCGYYFGAALFSVASFLMIIDYFYKTRTQPKGSDSMVIDVVLEELDDEKEKT